MLAGGEAQLERTWQAAQVWLPDVARPGPGSPPMTGLAATPDRIPAGVRLPTVLYAHDCGGPGAAAAVWGERLSREGYVVIAPDSRARSDGATARCPSSGGARLATRQGEIRYALRQTRLLPWVRQSAVFLLAVGEGATAAARDDTLAVSGSIVVGGAAAPLGRAPSLQLDGAGVPDEADSRRAIAFLRRLTPR